jgi:hypothetical protein
MHGLLGTKRYLGISTRCRHEQSERLGAALRQRVQRLQQLQARE